MATVVGHENSQLKFYDLNNGGCFANLFHSSASITSMSFHQNGLYLLTGCSEGFITKWDMRTMTKISNSKVHNQKNGDGVTSLEMSNQKFIGSCGADGRICLYR
jgi:WD40 repeat protein